MYFDRLLGLPCDMIFSVFTAASTLLHHSKTAEGAGHDTKTHLKLCIHWLSVLGKSWKSAGTRHQMLADSKYLPGFQTYADILVFDLPPELRNSNTSQVLRSPTPESSIARQGDASISVTPTVVANGHLPAGNAEIMDDWGFLRSFGDSTDDFFEFDAQLRGLLEAGFEPESMNFNG